MVYIKYINKDSLSTVVKTVFIYIFYIYHGVKTAFIYMSQGNDENRDLIKFLRYMINSRKMLK